MAGSGESTVGGADLVLDPEVAYWLEMSEARAMADVYRAAADTSDNPVGCQVAEIGGGVAFALTSIDVGFFNRTIGLGVERAATEADVDAVAAFYEGLDRSVAVAQVAPHAAPPDLIGWLEARGFARSARWAKVWRTLDDLPQATTSLRIERIDRSQADAFGSIGVEAFEYPAVVANAAVAAIGRTGWTHYMGFAGDEPVSVAALYVTDRFAWLGFGATLEAYRGRGGQSALFAERLRDAADLGCRLAFTETGEDSPDDPNPSYHNMIRAGFRLAYHRPNWVKRRP